MPLVFFLSLFGMHDISIVCELPEPVELVVSTTGLSPIVNSLQELTLNITVLAFNVVKL
jgi:hypothetical protein